MFAMIDGLWWLDTVCVFALGVWAGRRWSRVKMQAECRARNCDTIQQIRKEKMQISADKLTMEHRNEFMRDVVAAHVKKIHSLETSKGIMAQEIQNLTYQLPRQQRRMVQ